jgi:hypothetical protein
MSVAAGPIGRNIEGSGTFSSKGKMAAMYSYSRTKGLFGGARSPPPSSSLHSLPRSHPSSTQVQVSKVP